MRPADLYARWVLGGTTRRDNYAYDDFEREVVWVDSNRWTFGGQNLFGTIFLNEQLLQESSTGLTDYVFLHEIGHEQFHFVPRTILFLLRFVFTGIALLGVPVVFAQMVVLVIFAPTIEIAGTIILGSVLVTLLFLIPLVFVSWLDEGRAEVFAVSQIGSSQYQNCSDEIRRQSDKDWFKRALLRLLYPYPRLVIWFVNRSW